MTSPVDFPPGLGDQPRSRWPRVAVQEGAKPIDLLKPKSAEHERVKDWLMTRLQTSQRAMERFYPRWQVAERKMQAAITFPDWEEELRKLNRKGEVPKITRIIVPFTFATISTIVTFLLHSFTGRRPIFQVSTWKDETVDAAQMMELKLQYDADHTKLVRQMWSFFQNTQTYGLGILRCLWKVEKAMRTIRKEQKILTLEGGSRMVPVASREERTVYEGNEVLNQDPYMFFPDPRVPMDQVNARGEFVFWREFEGRHILKRLENQGLIKWVDHASRTLPRNTVSDSSRSILSEGEPFPGMLVDGSSDLRNYTQVDQGTVDIIPRELGIGESERIERWIFTMLNQDQIVQAEPFETDHDLHPVAVAEPYSQGGGFGEAGMADYLAPIQDAVTWFFNSHIDNVRKSLNDMLIVDPSMVEFQDLKNPEPGKLIRLKRAAFGGDVRAAVTQLAVQDVTKNHVEDAREIFRLGQFLSSVTDNVMGQQTQGGRKTATEVRQSGEAAGSRLAAMSRIISSQGVVDLTKMMSLNNQQLLTDEFYIQVVGEQGQRRPLRITPDQLAGDFYFPVNDGTLPQDRIALMDVWREIFVALLQDQELRAAYSVPRIFEHIAELGGARNIESFRTSTMPDDQFQNGLANGSLVPTQQAVGQMRGTNSVNATRGSPRDRILSQL